VLGLFYLTTVEKPSSISVYGLNYHIPLYSLGDSVDIYGNYSDVDSGSVSTGLLDLQIAGKGTTLGAHYNQQLTRINQYESKLVYGVDYKAYENSLLLTGYQLGHDVTVHPLSLSYQGDWTLDNGRAGIELTAVHNITAGSAADIELARSGGKDAYSILRYSADYTRSLKADWLFRVKFSGQSSPDALIPGEQFGVGGSNSVRGFMEREVANDSGYLTNLEIYSPSLCSSFKSMNGHCRVLAFYDNGHVSRNKALPGELNSESISSTGLGVRIDIAQSLNLQLDYGVVLESGGSQSEGDKRLHVAMNWAY
jgi:hemolysin activation/secretion protein